VHGERVFLRSYFGNTTLAEIVEKFSQLLKISTTQKSRRAHLYIASQCVRSCGVRGAFAPMLSLRSNLTKNAPALFQKRAHILVMKTRALKARTGGYVLAIYHLHVSIVSRSTGRSAVAASAYRAGEKIKNERDSITHDYTRKSGVVHSEIMLPENAPREYFNRSILWNAVEKSEKRCDAQTAREIDIALPVELDRKEQIDLMHEYIRENFINKGMCADFTIHDKKDGNPHAHVMLTTREVSEKGFNGKNRDWNKKELLEQWREKWAVACNERLQMKGLDERIDHRTLEAQGINREPTIHEGRNPEAIKENKEIKRRNNERTPDKAAEYMHELKQGYFILEKETSALKQQLTENRSEMQSLRYRGEQIDERAEQIKTMRGRAKEKAESYFKQTYYVTPDEATAEIKRLEYKIKDIERVQERLQNRLTPLSEEQEIFKLEYQRQKLLTDISPDKNTIQHRLMQLNNEDLPHSSHDRIAQIQSQRALDIVTERNFENIIKEIPQEQANVLIRQRKRERERDYTRIRYR